MVIVFRRIPAILLTYKLMPKCVVDIKEAIFMGYFGPIGIGAVFYVEHTRHLFHEIGESLTAEENNLTAAMRPVVYWLVVFSIFWHGLSIPALNMYYKWTGVQPITDEDGPAEVLQLSASNPAPKNSTVNEKRGSIMINNRFSRVYNTAEMDMDAVEGYRRRTQMWMEGRDVEAMGKTATAVQFNSPSPHYKPDLQRPDASKLPQTQYGQI